MDGQQDLQGVTGFYHKQDLEALENVLQRNML
jgi:hypothetical protein